MVAVPRTATVTLFECMESRHGGLTAHSAPAKPGDRVLDSRITLPVAANSKTRCR